ncbi:porin family protein [Caulobacter sp. NIBR2454]|uniref:porin family protein n=1 Tax=Caulobacter sp. NIBR2454 TaxID=3015996 RepID=UPI0022B680FA|nr:porin family protein [Caulobacter sp. NIBR2454]
MKLHHMVISAMLVAAAPVVGQAQTPSTTSLYGSLAYADTTTFQDVNYGSVVGRLGARFGRFVGVEGELGLGVNGDKHFLNDTVVRDDLKRQLAGYVVGYAPLKPNLDLFARVGYGQTKSELDYSGAISGSYKDTATSWNYGLGVQYFLDGSNGVRLDYTHQNFDYDRNADVWSIGYTRRF